MKLLKRRFAAAPEGTAVLFFIQIFSTLGFAVLYSTLVLYATKHLHLATKEATALMGVFGAFNYGLHLFGGYLGGRFLSNRNLFVGGMALQVIGCACISTGTLRAVLRRSRAFPHRQRPQRHLHQHDADPALHSGGSAPRRRFPLELRRHERRLLRRVHRRRLLPGHRELLEPVHLRDARQLRGHRPRLLQLEDAGRSQYAAARSDAEAVSACVSSPASPLSSGSSRSCGSCSSGPAATETIIKAICGAVALTLIYLTLRHPDRRERRNMTAYLILTIGSLMFWSLYQMAPSGLMLFAVNNVDLMIGRVKIQPQWIQNINTVCIVLGGPLLASLFTRMRARGWKIDIPKQFATSLLLMALGFLILPLGIKLAGVDGKSAFVWLFVSYVLQSIGELLISPIGYAMIGKLAPTTVSGNHDGQLDARDRSRVALRGRFLGHDPRADRHHGGRDQPRVCEAFRRARRRQPRGRYRARRADSVPAQADHRQGRDAARRNAGDCLPRRNVVEESRSRWLNGANGMSDIEGSEPDWHKLRG